ncbi:MAG TPA: HAMP domain-containing sensor histidine kinase [Anaeromyxobacteraceae bacterium]|nr:HAMP domain-containing sensor histidine kinase [Anaeromyxobacteraceae bacterium]
MVRLLTPGPELAKRPDEMIVPAAAKPCQAGVSAAAGRPSRVWLPLTWGDADTWKVLIPIGFFVMVVGILLAAAYPTWRVAVVALPALRQVVVFSFLRKRNVRMCLNVDEDQKAWFVVCVNSTLLLTTTLGAAVTGGIHSPLLVTLAAAYFATVLIVGDRRQTRLLLGATGLAVLALALLPTAWTGPPLGASLDSLLTAASVLGVGASLAPLHAVVQRRREDLARAREEMVSEALARAESLERVGSKLAHELKNPLTAVKALVQLGLRNPAEAASHQRLEVVEKEVSRVQEILQNYLSFTRPLQEVRPRPVGLGPLVSDTLVVLSARADGARVRLYAEGDATVEADPRRLKEALLNLVVNAIEATPPGGEVAVEVRPAEEGAEIVIRDTGRGMPSETLRRIGTPFFTTREDGTGLGVVLARSVIAQHGGSLRYESEPGKGTQVRVALPRASMRDRHAASAVGR